MIWYNIYDVYDIVWYDIIWYMMWYMIWYNIMSRCKHYSRTYMTLLGCRQFNHTVMKIPLNAGNCVLSMRVYLSIYFCPILTGISQTKNTVEWWDRQWIKKWNCSWNICSNGLNTTLQSTRRTRYFYPGIVAQNINLLIAQSRIPVHNVVLTNDVCLDVTEYRATSIFKVT
jgi:hypothetical protein